MCEANIRKTDHTPGTAASLIENIPNQLKLDIGVPGKPKSKASLPSPDLDRPVSGDDALANDCRWEAPGSEPLNEHIPRRLAKGGLVIREPAVNAI